MKTTLYLVRHAEATGNVEHIFQGHTDSDLTKKGYLQLERLKERFKEIPYDIIYSSPLKRAYYTAEAVNYYHNHEIIIEQDVIEICGGIFEGQRFDDLPILYPEEYDLWQNSPHKFDVQDGETMANVYKRMKKSISNIITINQGKTIVVVSHGCAIKNYLCYIMNVAHENIEQIPWLDNTAISKITYDDDFAATIDFFNDASHLSDDTAPQNLNEIIKGRK